MAKFLKIPEEKQVSQQPTYLFPVNLITDNKEKKLASYLLPRDKEDAPIEQLDWLENPSFQPEDAATVENAYASQVKYAQLSSTQHVSSGEDDKIASVEISAIGDNEHVNKKFDVTDSLKKRTKKHKHRHISKRRDDSPEYKSSRPKHTSRSRDDSRSHPSSKHSSRHSHKSTKHKHSHGRHGSPPHTSSSTSKRKEKSSVLKDVKTLSETQTYGIDRTRDKANLAYESLNRAHIAQYHRPGLQNCLGLTSHPSSASQAKRGQPTRYFSKVKKQTNSLECVDLSQGNINVILEDNLDFIPLGYDPQPRSQSIVNPLGIYDKMTENYLMGIGPCKVTATDVQSDHAVNDTLENPVRKRTADYNKRLHDEPHNVQLWLEFVKFQDEVFQEEEMKDAPRAVMIQRQLELKEAIFEKALAKNPRCVALKLAQLEVCGDLWDRQRLAKEWKQFVFTHPNDPAVWRHYLRFSVFWFKSFTCSNLIKSYAECLNTLDGIRQGTVKSHDPLPHTSFHMIDLFTELCYILKQAGHMEKALSLFQCQLEYNLHYDTVASQTNTEDMMDLLEDFWESGAGRLGEEGALGWAAWVRRKTDNLSPNGWSSKDEEEADEEAILEQQQSVENTWIAMEIARCSRHWLPWKPNIKGDEAEGDCEDPERLVFFEDIKNCLFSVKLDVEKFHLLSRFLNFLTQQPCPKSSSPAASWLQEKVESVEHFFSSRDKKILKSVKGVHPRQDHFHQFVSNIYNQTLPLFKGIQKTKLTLMLIDYELYKVKDRCCLSDNKDMKHGLKNVKKLVKTLLKEEHNRNELAIWEVYARIEWNLGNKEQARKVLDTAVAMVPRDLAAKTTQQCLLYKLAITSAELELGLNEDHCGGISNTVKATMSYKAMTSLLRLCGEEHCTNISLCEQVPSTLLLKCKKFYEQQLDEAMFELSQKTYTWDDYITLSYAGSFLLHCNVALALLLYLTSGVDAASTTFQRVLHQVEQTLTKSDDINTLCPHSVYRRHVYERLYEAYVSLVEYDTRTTFSKLSVLRQPLEDALLRLPDNWFLLKLFVELESRCNIAGRLRRHFNRSAHRLTTPTPWLWAILAEVRRMKSLLESTTDENRQRDFTLGELLKYPGVNHQAHAWFEKALSQPGCRHCLLLWRLYLHFEAEQGNMGNAKSVFYRGIQQCPWAKTLYMDFVRYFPAQLQEVVDLMTEKEVRVQLPLEELSLLMDSKPSNYPDQTLDTEMMDSLSTGGADKPVLDDKECFEQQEVSRMELTDCIEQLRQAEGIEQLRQAEGIEQLRQAEGIEQLRQAEGIELLRQDRPVLSLDKTLLSQDNQLDPDQADIS